MISDVTGSAVKPKRQHYGMSQAVPTTGAVRCLPSGALLSRLSRILAPTPQQVRVVIIRLRNDFHLSRGQLAAYMGCSFSTVKAWERGERKPSAMARQLIWLMDAYLRGKPVPNELELIRGWRSRLG